jgi:2-methylcitrate dehydratase
VIERADLVGRMDEVTRRIVDYTAAIDATKISVGARAEVGRRLIDSIACAIAGFGSEPVDALRQLARARDQSDGCLVWGTASRTAPEVAALVNASAVRVFDYSDYTVGGHPSDNIAAIVAACEWAGRSVDDLVAGVLVNYEVFGELGRLMIRYRGWDQGTTATIAAACGVGKVLGLSRAQLAAAIGMVATANIATGKARRGALTAWKGVAGPYAASAAVVAAEMAAAGITAPADAFAGEFGFWEQVSGPFEIERLDPFAEAHYLFRTATKRWPVQFDVQPAVLLALQMRDDDVSLDQVERIAVETSEWTWKGTARDANKWAPDTRETADHSLPYIFAVALQQGGVGRDDFSDEAISSADRRALMNRITVQPASDITADMLDYCWMRANVSFADGATRCFEAKEPRAKSMTDEELRDKWHLLVDNSTLGLVANELLDDLVRLRGDQTVRDLIDRLMVTEAAMG